ncbi:hypothetical protein P153DRAFT_431615 [Dothidotthia symphoricarpi CBS 119687]|uniref:Zinc-binding loop region of homing endonuclease domain-containing protein n=1 Tax=Dothidotthia symphoricarpi CBS 119687 TaxID=1392245 RepID=A0A6A6A9V3_9PLEO|nr:uncharacterized protein P153DRAFT_431615 [Dothidotthia symphoricarpi CBS 119687]KAF2128722.1 hypothetical protein P153DRAFT_431615 [Dothidotthia symphoricarpi CBS 119687]
MARIRRSAGGHPSMNRRLSKWSHNSLQKCAGALNRDPSKTAVSTPESSHFTGTGDTELQSSRNPQLPVEESTGMIFNRMRSGEVVNTFTQRELFTKRESDHTNVLDLDHLAAKYSDELLPWDNRESAPALERRLIKESPPKKRKQGKEGQKQQEKMAAAEQERQDLLNDLQSKWLDELEKLRVARLDGGSTARSDSARPVLKRDQALKQIEKWSKSYLTTDNGCWLMKSKSPTLRDKDWRPKTKVQRVSHYHAHIALASTNCHGKYHELVSISSPVLYQLWQSIYPAASSRPAFTLSKSTRLEVSHLCHKKRCVNPNHLKIETNTVNRAREDCRGTVFGPDGSVYHLCTHAVLPGSSGFNCVIPAINLSAGDSPGVFQAKLLADPAAGPSVALCRMGEGELATEQVEL